MDTYLELEEGGYTFGNMSIPNAAGNRDYQEMNQKVRDGEAVITPFALSVPEQVGRLITQIASDRYETESAGVSWSDPAGQEWFLDTSIDSQNRFTTVRTAIESGARVGSGVWKCAMVTAGVKSLAYRPTTNAELTEWSQLVHDHVQKCFQAESLAANKALAGDLTADFLTEFNTL